MPANHLDLQNSDDVRDVIHQAVAALSAGKIIAFPTETVYGLAVSALVPEAVQRLVELKERDTENPIALAIKSVDAALDYVPDMSPLARRLARRCWPGPVTLVLDATHPDSVINRLDPTVRRAIVPNGTVGLRVPAHEMTLQIMQLCAGPILLTSANLKGQPAATTGQQALAAIGDRVDLILDDGPCKIGQASTVVRVTKDEFKILREGVVDQPTLDRLTGFIALVVCTGNTCRSPMGEALLRGQIADSLGCKPEELEGKGMTIMSAGIAAMPGAPAAPQANAVMQEMGFDISNHASQPITGRLAQYADVILTMTNGHREALVSHWPALENRVVTVRQDGGDVSDPIGASVETYRKCASQINEHLGRWVCSQDFSQFENK